jgi:hypothetical protein
MTQNPNSWCSKEVSKDVNEEMWQSFRDSMRGLSPRKFLRLAIILTMSFVCWFGVGCLFVEMVQLTAR